MAHLLPGHERDARGSTTAAPLTKAFWISFLFSFGYLVTAVLCLRQWGESDPWTRLNLFTGGYLATSAVALVKTIGFGRTVLRSRAVMHEFTGITYDPQLVPLVTSLSLGELTIFLDYGQWHLVPALEQPALQGFGLPLYIASLSLLLWTDTYIRRQFSGDLNRRFLMTDGPFRYIRHPRHLSLIASKFGAALVFASAAGWVLAVAWLLLFLRRIRLEEPHLRKLFGAEYDAYASRTWRLLPGIY